MKKILVLFFLILSVSAISYSTEILTEVYLLEKVLPGFEEGKHYQDDSEKEIIAIRVNSDFQKKFEIYGFPVYFKDSSGKVQTLRIGDYLITDRTFANIFMKTNSEFNKSYKPVNK